MDDDCYEQIFQPVITKVHVKCTLSCLHYTRGITAKRVTSSRVHLCDLARGQRSEEGRSGGELSPILRPICPVGDSNPWLTAPIAIS